MSETPTELRVEDVMARRFELDQEISLIEGQHKLELEPLKEEQTMCERFVQEHMLAQGLQQLKTGAGMTYFTTGDTVTVEDADAFFDYVMENRAAFLLNKAANKTAVKEFIESNAGEKPPGIKYDSFRKLAWRRGKS